jgi:hypothetical protein
MGYCIRFIERNPSINRVGLLEGWFLLKGIPPKGRILGLFILVVPLVTSKIIGLARKIRKGYPETRTRKSHIMVIEITHWISVFPTFAETKIRFSNMAYVSRKWLPTKNG